MGREERLAGRLCSRSSILSVGTKGKRSVMCAGTPCWADQSCFARHSLTRGSASGTSTIKRAARHGRRVRSGCERRRRADHVAPETVVAARARDLPEPALRLRRASRRLGRSSRGAPGAGARDHHPRRDRRCSDDLPRGPAARRLSLRRLERRRLGLPGRDRLRHRRLLARWPPRARVGKRAARGQLVSPGAARARLRRSSARPLARSSSGPFGSRSTEATSSGPAAPTPGPASGSSTC